MTVIEAVKALPACPRRCSECPTAGHHWMLDFGDGDDEDEFEATSGLTGYPEPRLRCKHCAATMEIDVNDPNLPEI